MTAAAAPDPGTAGAATLPRLFAGWVAEYGAEPALSRRVDGVFTAFTYDELDRRASVLALALARELGVRRGELVALISDNRPEWLVCSLAIHFLGAVDVPRASDTPPDILEAILRHAEPAVVIVEDPAQLPLVREALPGLRAAVVIDGAAGRGDAAGSSRSLGRRRRRLPGVHPGRADDARRGGVAGVGRRGRAAPRRRAARGPGDDHLHLGHDRRPQGRGAHARQLRAQPARAPQPAGHRARAGAHAAAAVARPRASDAAHVPEQGVLRALQRRRCTCAAT